MRGRLGLAWQTLNRWDYIEPVCHRTPLPYALFRAMVSTAVHLKWFRFAGVMILTFEGLCRPGETLNAERSDLLLPEDLFAEDPHVAFLRIRKPKGRTRGLGVVQHSKISGELVVRFLSRVSC